MATKITNQIHKVILPSTPQSVEQVEVFLSNCLNSVKLSNTLYNDILVVLTEAVNNGITHGNNCNPNKLVTVSFHKKKEMLNFAVSDEGNGFNPENIPDPTNQSCLEDPNGRGVFLMHTLAHQIDYKENGRKVLFQFDANK